MEGKAADPQATWASLTEVCGILPPTRFHQDCMIVALLNVDLVGLHLMVLDLT